MLLLVAVMLDVLTVVPVTDLVLEVWLDVVAFDVVEGIVRVVVDVNRLEVVCSCDVVFLLPGSPGRPGEGLGEGLGPGKGLTGGSMLELSAPKLVVKLVAVEEVDLEAVVLVVLVVVVKLLVEELSTVDVLDNVSEMLVVAELDVLVVLTVAVVVDVVATCLN